MHTPQVVEKREDENGWWHGKLNNVTGLFYPTYFERIELPTMDDTATTANFIATAAVPADDESRVVVIKEYKGEDDTQLTLVMGAVITIEEKHESGWW